MKPFHLKLHISPIKCTLGLSTKLYLIQNNAVDCSYNPTFRLGDVCLIGFKTRRGYPEEPGNGYGDHHSAYLPALGDGCGYSFNVGTYSGDGYSFDTHFGSHYGNGKGYFYQRTGDCYHRPLNASML